MTPATGSGLLGLPGGAAAAPPIDHPYFRFVTTGDDGSIDVIDHVAFSLYQRDKLAYLAEHVHVKQGQQPSADELAAVVRGSMLKDRIEAYKLEAQYYLQAFTEAVLKPARAELEATFDKRLNDELKKSRPFLKTLVENMLANVVAVIVTGLVIIGFFVTKQSFVTLVGDAFGYEVRERPAKSLTVEPKVEAPAAAASR